MPRDPDRRRHPLITLDRALLALTFAAGGWAATAEYRQADLAVRMGVAEASIRAGAERQILQRDEIHRVLGDHDTEVAVSKSKLENIEKSVQALAESVARMANRMGVP